MFFKKNKSEKVVKKVSPHIASTLSMVLNDAAYHYSKSEDESGMMALAARMHSSVCHSYIFAFANMSYILMLPVDMNRDEYHKAYMESLSYIWKTLIDTSALGNIPAILPLDNDGDPMDLQDVWNDYVANEDDPLCQDAKKFAEHDVKYSFVYHEGESIIPISLLRILKSSDWNNFKDELLNDPEFGSSYEMWDD